MSSPVPPALGIAGTGWMAETMAATFAAIGAPIGAVLSGSEARATALAGRHAARGVTDLAAFLEAGCGAIYIASANAAHYQTARAALQAGLPVLVEKPLTTSAGLTAALIALAGETGTLLVENYWTLTLPAHRRIKALCGAGSLGAPRHMAFDFSQPITAEILPGLFDPASGGVLLDRAVYGLAAARDLLGPIAQVQAEITRDASGCDVAAALLLRHEAGATSQVSVSLTAGGPNSLELGLTRGHVRLAPSLGGEQLAVTAMAPPTGRWVASTDGLKAKLKQSPLLRRLKGLASSSGEFHGFGAGAYAPMASHFLDLVTSGQRESDLVPHALSREVADLLDDLRSRPE
jgi:predicted dehydrogenase